MSILACGMCGGILELGAVSLATAIVSIVPIASDRLRIARERRRSRAALALLPREPARGPTAIGKVRIASQEASAARLARFLAD